MAKTSGWLRMGRRMAVSVLLQRVTRPARCPGFTAESTISAVHQGAVPGQRGVLPSAVRDGRLLEDQGSEEGSIYPVGTPEVFRELELLNLSIEDVNAYYRYAAGQKKDPDKGPQPGSQTGPDSVSFKAAKAKCAGTGELNVQ